MHQRIKIIDDESALGTTQQESLPLSDEEVSTREMVEHIAFCIGGRAANAK